jgi:hypothetical protein
MILQFFGKAYCLHMQGLTILELLDPENVGFRLVRNVGNYLSCEI